MSGKRDIGLDVLKLIATVAVVRLHTGFSDGFLDEILYYLSGIAVPIFFMVSGALTLNRGGNAVTYKYCFQRVLRILRIIVLWNLLFVVYDFLRYKTFINPFYYAALSFVQNGFLFHFWYLWALLFLYCLAPVLKKAFGNEKVNKRITVTWLCIMFFLSLYNVYAELNGRLRIEQLVPQVLRFWVYIGYYWLGGLIYKNRNKSVRIFEEYKGAWIVWMIVYSVACSVFEYLYCVKFIRNHSPENLFTNPFIIAWTVLVFVVFTSIAYPEKLSGFVFKAIKFSFGVYVMHPFFIVVLQHLGYWENTNWGFNFLIVLLSSVFITFIINRIPVINKLIHL